MNVTHDKPAKARPLEDHDDVPREYSSKVLFENRYNRILKRARSICNDLNQQFLKGYYQLGKLVSEAAQLTYQSTIRRSSIELLANDLQVHQRTLYCCAQLVRAVPEEDFIRLAKPPVCWDHLRTLMNLGQLAQLEHWAERICREHLSAQDIANEMRQGKPSRRAGSGKRPQVPRNLKSGLGQLAAKCDTFQRQLDLSLFSDEFDLVDELFDTPPDELTEEMRDAYADAAGKLEAIKAAASQQARRMRESIGHFDDVFERRREYEQSETD